MKQPLTAHWCNVLEYVEILWALSDPSPVTGIYLWNPFPSPPTSELTHTLPTNDSQPSLLCESEKLFFFLNYFPLKQLSSFSLTPFYALGLKNGLGTLALVSAGCHRLMKAVWTLGHAAVISAYLCIRRASSVYARQHGCGYSSFSYSVCVRECVRARSYVRACMHTSV